MPPRSRITFLLNPLSSLVVFVCVTLTRDCKAQRCHWALCFWLSSKCPWTWRGRSRSYKIWKSYGSVLHSHRPLLYNEAVQWYGSKIGFSSRVKNRLRGGRRRHYSKRARRPGMSWRAEPKRLCGSGGQSAGGCRRSWRRRGPRLSCRRTRLRRSVSAVA